MRRSLLFIPSNNPAMLQNADIFGADSVIFDLEDAVNITEKDNARNLLYYYLNAHKDLPMEVVVRINGLDTKYHKEDLEKIVSDNIDTIMLPKARIEESEKITFSLGKIHNISSAITNYPDKEGNYGGEGRGTCALYDDKVLHATGNKSIKIYKGEEHNQTAQQPIKVELKGARN